MSRDKHLKEYQLKSVDEILERLKSHSVYAVADEVGLGKTLVVAETIYKSYAIFRSSKKKNKPSDIYIYYVAPSYELIIQNVHAVSKHIKTELLRGNYNDTAVLSYASRLTMLLADSERAKNRFKSKNKDIDPQFYIHIVGLTPGTSFDIRGKGRLGERALLASAFALDCNWDNQKIIRRWWYALIKDPPKTDEEILNIFERYTRDIPASTIRNDLKNVFMSDWEIREARELIFSKSKYKWEQDVREHNLMIGKIRKRIIEKLIYESKFKASFLVLDEWHKYADMALNPKKGMNEFIQNARKNDDTKTLLVSATPFKVDFPENADEDGNILNKKLKEKNHFEHLFELIYGDEAQRRYKEFTRKRTQYTDLMADFIKDYRNKDLKLTVAQAKDDYINALREVVIRNERPKQDPTNINSKEINCLGGFDPSWGKNKKQLKEFLDLLPELKDKTKEKPTRSPVLSMFNDGSTFPTFYNNSIYGSKVRNLANESWKIKAFKSELKKMLKFDLFSPELPPLWLPQGEELDKALLFTRYRFTPNEIAETINNDLKATRYNKKPSGTIFKNFPVSDKRFRSQKRSFDYHWIYFYPPLYLEYYPDKRLTQSELDEIFNSTDSLKDVVFKIEGKLLGDKGHERLKLRFQSIDDHKSSKGSSELKTILKKVFVDKKSEETLGMKLSEVFRKVFNGQIFPGHVVEKNILFIAYWFHRLFVSLNAVLIFKEVKKSKIYPKKYSKKGDVNLDFVTWYCNRYKFIETFVEYLELLNMSYSDPEDTLSEFYHSMALKPSNVYGRFYRPFLDSKDGDSGEDDTGESYSQQTIRNAFNSPFPPYVLASTSIGQEGLDFHRYCSTIIHWSPPHSPAAMQQREGRVDRYMSLQVRRAHKELGIDIKSTNINDEKLRGMHPYFTVVDDMRVRKNVPNRKVLFLPFSSQAASWNRCLKRMYYNDILIGHPDPIAIERMFADHIESLTQEEREELYLELRDLFIDLSPK